MVGKIQGFFFLKEKVGLFSIMNEHPTKEIVLLWMLIKLNEVIISFEFELLFGAFLFCHLRSTQLEGRGDVIQVQHLILQSGQDAFGQKSSILYLLIRSH